MLLVLILFLKLQLPSILCPNFNSLQRYVMLIKIYVHYFYNVFLINPYYTHHKSEKKKKKKPLKHSWSFQLMHTFCFIFQSFKKLLTTEFHATYDQYLEATESPAVYT